ncbi:MAG: hypothetical protein ACOYLI_11320 [Synechococcus lacustris]|jgi:hypothetical protein
MPPSSSALLSRKLCGNALLLGLLLLAGPGAWGQTKLNSKQLEEQKEPLTKADLKPTFDAVVECAQQNQEASCLVARQLADRLLDRPYLTALCKDTAFVVIQKAKTVAINNYDRKDLLLTKANDLIQLCQAKEPEKPPAPAAPSGPQKKGGL